MSNNSIISNPASGAGCAQVQEQVVKSCSSSSSNLNNASFVVHAICENGEAFTFETEAHDELQAWHFAYEMVASTGVRMASWKVRSTAQ